MADPKDPKDPSFAKASKGEEDKHSLTSNEDKVAQAYENISKKLEKLRNGGKIDEEEGSDEVAKGRSDEEDDPPAGGEGLKEWKGPEGIKGKQDEGDEPDDEVELRKVKLKNLEEDEEGEAEDKEEEDKPKKKWEPREGDPLDEEPSDAKALDGKDKEEESDENEGDQESGEVTKGRSDEESPLRPVFAEATTGKQGYEGRAEESNEQEESEEGGAAEPDGSRVRMDPQPDSLDDLTEASSSAETADDKEDDFDIPNLKGSRQRKSDIGYNRDYQEKSSMENNDPNNFFSQHNQSQPPKRANRFHLLVLVVIGVAVISFTVYILKGGFGTISINPEPSPPPPEQTSPIPTPTPTPEPERSKYKVRVLNGSGKTGLAKTVSDKLKELGYQVDKTGNATNSAFTQTVVRVKTEAEPFIPQVVKDLAPEFDAAGNTSLKDADTVDIEIILGAK